jgi:hypothetical protein
MNVLKGHAGTACRFAIDIKSVADHQAISRGDPEPFRGHK